MKFIPGQKKLYAAPILANGEISIQLGPDGTMAVLDEPVRAVSSPSRYIWWQARRRADLPTHPLFPFGRFIQTLSQNGTVLCVKEADQELDTDHAAVWCRTVYEDESVIETEAFIADQINLIAVKKRFYPASAFDYQFTYALCGKEGIDRLPARLSCTPPENGMICYYAPGQDDCCGCVRVFDDCGTVSVSGTNSISLNKRIEEPCTICYYILLADTITDSNPASWSEQQKKRILEDGWTELEKAHREEWDAYDREGGASLCDPLLDRVYRTAQYHQKCYTTKWSLPVAINDESWDGRFFAFDEHFMLGGLLTTGHINAALHVPYHRLKGLPIARGRCSSGSQRAARYPWETLENNREGAPQGFWMEHIFHMAAITLGAYECWKYTADLEYLKQVYPMISACAEFYRRHSIYHMGNGRVIVGKCTDLERLGAGVENAYMTTCGVIATLRAFADCARILDCDADIAAESLSLADALLASLPNDGEKYVPFPGCTDKSIAVYAGIYPYTVDGLNTEWELRAMRDYEEQEETYGNMYAVGQGVCSWYAAWKSVVYAALKMPEKACGYLEYIGERTGDFGEVYEIWNKESNTYYRPWFTTAAGMYVHAFNAILLSCQENQISVAAALSEKYRSFRFTLPSHGDVRVHAAASDGVITELEVTFGENCTYDYVDVEIPGRWNLTGDFGGERITEDNAIVLRISRR